MKQQGAHPEDAESTSDASSRPGSATGSGTDAGTTAPDGKQTAPDGRSAGSKSAGRNEDPYLDEAHIDEVYRNGVLLAPLTATMIADLVLDRREHPDLARVRPDRFGL